MGFAPETIVFLYACLLGVGLGIAFDFFRLLRLVFGGQPFLVFLEDLLFFFLAAGCTLYFSIMFCSGWMRVFVLTGEFLGFVIYYFTVGELVIRCLRLICSFFRWLLLKIWKIILWPPIRLLLHILQKTKEVIVWLLQKLSKPFFFHKFFLKHPSKMLYNKNNKQADTRKEG